MKKTNSTKESGNCNMGSLNKVARVDIFGDKVNLRETMKYRMDNATAIRHARPRDLDTEARV